METLEKIAGALEMLMYQLFYDGEEPPKLPNLPKRKTGEGIVWGQQGQGCPPACYVLPPVQPHGRRVPEIGVVHGTEDGAAKGRLIVRGG